MSFSMTYSKLTELSANDVEFISVDRQRLDLSKYIYTYGTVHSIFVEIQPDFTNIKNDPRKLLQLEDIKYCIAIEDPRVCNRKVFSYFSTKTYFIGSQKNRRS